MKLVLMGGWVMWPLLALSVITLTVILERWLLYAACPFPGKGLDEELQEVLREGDAGKLLDRLKAIAVLRSFAAILEDREAPNREAALQLAGAAVLRRMGARLPLLALTGRLAPLLGLLGTILGMITTFSRLAVAQAGIDMTLLAEGIWQALLTTASGLIIAIPALLAHHVFATRRARLAEALAEVGNTVLALDQRLASEKR